MSSHATPRGSHAAVRRRWTELVAEYEGDSLTQRAFCEQHDLVLSSFTRWRRRLLEERAEGPEPFVRVMLAEDPPTNPAPELSSAALRVRLPSGVCIEGVSAANAALVAELVRTL